MKYTKTQKAEAIAKLRELLPVGSTVHTLLTHVSASGMSRSIKAIVIKENEPFEISYWVARALDESIDQKRGGLKRTGCGMDMGFDMVHNLSYVLHGFPKDTENAGYTIKQRWL